MQQRPYPFPAVAGIEPPLHELLADDTLHLLLQRDRLMPADVVAVVRTWRANRQQNIAYFVDAA